MSILLWTLAILSTLATAFFTYRADRAHAVSLPWLTAGLRTILVALVWMLLLAPHIQLKKTETQKPLVVFLQDESSSIKTALGADSAAYRKSAEDLLNKLSKNYRVVRWGFGNQVVSDSLFRFRQSGTDLSMPLARVQDFFGNQNLGAVILASDGRFNQGLNPLFQKLSLGSPLYTLSIGDTAQPIDLRIPQVYANRSVSKNAQVEIRADLVATGCAGFEGEARLMEGSTQLGSIPISVKGDRFDKSLGFTIRAGAAGLHHYILQASTASGEKNIQNNRRDLFIEVVENKKNILIAAAAPHPDIAAIREALSGTEAYTVKVNIGLTLPAPETFDVLILHGWPQPNIADHFPGKAIWQIISPSSAQVSSPVAGLNLVPQQQHDAYAVSEPGFSAFSLPPGLNAVLDRLPPLSTAAGDIQPAPGTQVLFSQRNEKQPLWMVLPARHAQALLLGEGIWRWRFYEYRYFQNHSVVDECIRQTVALLAADAGGPPFRASIPKFEWNEGENVSLNAYLLNPAGEQVNGPDAQIVFTDSAGHTTRYSLERNGSAYRVYTGPQAPGTYKFNASTTYNGTRLNSGGSFVVTAVSQESMDQGADYRLLFGLAQRYGGQAFPASRMSDLYDSLSLDNRIRPMIIEHSSVVPLIDWKLFFFLILIVAAGEWLLRKYWLAQ
jgi:hypothetical protein